MTEAGEEEGRTVTFDPEDAVVYTATGLIVCGVVCIVVGYTVPRDYTFNPYARARDMEAIEIYYAHLSQSLDLTIVIGMGFIAIGGIILSSLLTFISCTESTTQHSVPSERSAIISSRGRGYGTSAGTTPTPRSAGGDKALCERWRIGLSRNLLQTVDIDWKSEMLTSYRWFSGRFHEKVYLPCVYGLMTELPQKIKLFRVDIKFHISKLIVFIWSDTALYRLIIKYCFCWR